MTATLKWNIVDFFNFVAAPTTFPSRIPFYLSFSFDGWFIFFKYLLSLYVCLWERYENKQASVLLKDCLWERSLKYLISVLLKENAYSNWRMKQLSNVMTIDPANTNWGGMLSTVDPLIKVACFVKKENNIFHIKMSWSKLVRTRRFTKLSLPLG